ncbi:hypothetical protein J6590_043734 [Homalodisca vitripennis]|nr:hypothetical protein J6590_043734 [Homalodisca vitripennis]
MPSIFWRPWRSRLPCGVFPPFRELFVPFITSAGAGIGTLEPLRGGDKVDLLLEKSSSVLGLTTSLAVGIQYFPALLFPPSDPMLWLTRIIDGATGRKVNATA